MTIGFLTWQSGLLMSLLSIDQRHVRAIDLFRLAGFAIWVVALLWNIFSGRAMSSDPAVREAMNDELTQAHRAEAFRFGYLFTLLAVSAAYALALFEPVTALEVLPLVIVVGVASASLRFLYLDRH
jgi:hydrogenase-4 membrane subunit HyfE